jgi:hypothetical protein
MAIACPTCGRNYDVTLFQFGRRIQCDCGSWVDLTTGHMQTDVTIDRDAGAGENTHNDTTDPADDG